MTPDLSPSLNSAPVSLRDCAIFLDFDGTLAPLQDDPDTVSLPDGGESLLLALNTKLNGALVLISGRDIRDLSKRTPMELLRAGGHGLEVCEPGETPALAQTSIEPLARQKAEDLVAPHPGVRIEDKGPVLAVHFRQNPAVEAELLASMTALAATLPDYKAQHGKMVIELKPTRANNGMALASLMQSAPFLGRKPIMVGDDTTDEDAMQTATDLGGFGIKVGEGETCANYRMKDPEAVWGWLRRLVDEHT